MALFILMDKISKAIDKGELVLSYAIYLCFGLPPYFIGTYHRLIFPLALNGILSPDYASSGLLEHHFRFELR